MVESMECCKLEQVLAAVVELKGLLDQAHRQGEPVHVVERSLREWGRKMSLLALEAYIKLHGTGDSGPATVSPCGEEMDRLPKTKLRSYLSAFGPVNIERTIYSAGNHQREYAPLDALLGLPEGKFSFLLQDFAQMLEILFRETPRPDDEPPRPRPCGKHVWAALDAEFVHEDGEVQSLSGLDTTFGWLSEEWRKRDPQHDRPLVRLMDGEHRLWDAADYYLPTGGHPDDADVLDIMHVAEYLWDAAAVLETHREYQEAFFHDKLGRILRGEVRAVITNLRLLATRRQVRGEKLKTIAATCHYFEHNANRMRYDEYLRKGYPIGSGAVEGACRHLVKDRLERTGMRWVREGAQAMLNLRSLWINEEWDDYQQYYVDTELDRLYPNRKSLIQRQTCKLP